jgi:tetratricopeptide (TPR) repeat protein
LFLQVRAVITERDELISRVKRDHKIQMKVAEPLSITMFNTGKSIAGVDGQFVFSQALIDCLLRMKSNQTDRNELITYCKNEYKDKPVELCHIHQLEHDYSPNKALWWYTRESFFYRTLNAALRTQNIHMIFLYRSYIADICHQLQQYQYKERIQVYRCQLMSTDELEYLKQYIGQFISMNSFLSTSIERSVALFYLGDITERIDLQRILFEIDADSRVIKTKSFADITTHSEFIAEAEVLFTLGSIFRLNSVHPGDDRVWTVRMTLCNDEEHDLKQVLVHMKKQNGSEATTLRTLGKLLWRMGKLDLAEKYYSRLLNEAPTHDIMLCTLYEDLADITSQKGDYNMSIQWQQKLLAIKEETSTVGNINNEETVKTTSKFHSSTSINTYQSINIGGSFFKL